MAELKGTSLDILEENLEKMKQDFPEAFEEGKINFDILRQILGGYVDDAREKYQFTWNGKGKALHISQTPSMGTLRPCPEKSKNWDATKNLYIEGDNLEVLKILQRSYHRAIKMIYIDPPYNTGHDFVYKDDFKDNIENYKQVTGQVDAEGRALSANTESGGRYHTNWLNMMYPRLRLARNLLTDDGVIFISIDDNEIDNLKQICNEIFGEENLVAEIPWQSRASVQNDTDFSVNHEYICAYARKRRQQNRRLKASNFTEWHKKDDFVVRPLPLDVSNFSNPDNDPRGLWKADPFDAPNVRENLTYAIKNPNTGEEFWPPKGRCWRTEERSFKKYLADHRIVWGKDGKGRPQLKSFYAEKCELGSVDTSWFSADRVGTTRNGTAEVMKLFNGTVMFDKPKPTSLLQKLIYLSNAGPDDTILDFFSGSGTTAHAVFMENIKDNGHKKFILVQIPAETPKNSSARENGFQTICDIGEERIRRAGALIEKEAEEKNQEAPDTGFKVFRLDSSNIRRWNPDKKDLAQSLWDYVDNFVEGRTEEDVVYEIMLKTGIDLSCPVEKLERDGHTVYSIGMGALFICLDDHVNEDVAKVLTALHQELSPETWKVVFRDNAFDRDADKTNVREMLKCEGLDPVDFLTI